MLINLCLIGVSLLLLFFGAEALVRGSASLAIRAGLSSLLVGLTIVAFGTSSPELVVSLNAAWHGQGDISLGNVVGSNSFNIGVILGLTALICPVPVHHQIIRLDAPLVIFASLLIWLLMWDSELSRIEGGVLFLGLVVYLIWSILQVRRDSVSEDMNDQTDSIPKVSKHWGWDVLLIVAGLAVLVVGSRLLVDNATILAKSWGVSEAVIGLTIVAAGTSMPELATSVVAALRREPDIAIGNIVGSNLFNILGILGLSGLVLPLSAPNISVVDYAVMIAFAVLLWPLLYTGKVLHRVEGVLLLAVYGGYLWWLWPKA